MQTPQGKEGYGLALLRTEKLIAGQEMRGHTGSAYGLYSAMFFQPKEKFGFVVINNGSRGEESSGVNTVNYKVIQVLYRHFISRQQ
jgi:D-alanyl-D-alanine carboxypeptidase